MKKRVYDFRSDTLTVPTPEMMAAIADAEVGDSARGDDPTHNRLEEVAAELVEKEAALFLPSGTMCNLSAILAHTHPGQEILIEERAHIYNSEVGGLSAVGGTIARPIHGTDGVLAATDIKKAINPDVGHKAATGLICLENTLNAAGGIVFPQSNASQIRAVADKACLPIHLDGARLFNAAAYLDESVAALSSFADSVMFGLAKGLGAPMGSILAGNAEFIARAKKKARMLGGGMRQTGMMAAAALVALKDPYTRLKRDNEVAYMLWQGLKKIDASAVGTEAQTNIVNFYVDKYDDNASTIVRELNELGILANFAGTKIRFVTYSGIDEKAVAACLAAVERVLSARSSASIMPPQPVAI